MAKCEICLKDALRDSIALFRINEVGVTGIFRCEDHIEGYQVDAAVRDITDIIIADNNPKPLNNIAYTLEECKQHLSQCQCDGCLVYFFITSQV